MAIDAMKILGALMNSGALSRGSGSNVLGSVLGAVVGGGGQSASSGGLGSMLGSLMGGGNAQQAQGGMAGMLGSLLGGGQGQPQGGGGLGALLGAAMGQLNNAQSGGSPELAQFGDASKPQAEEHAMLMVKAMINAAKSDGHVDAEEQKKIVEKLGDVSEEELEFVKQALTEPLDVDAFVKSIPRELGPEVYVVSLMAIDLDTNQEAQYLDQLVQGLGMTTDACNQIHEQLGVPKLYS